LAIFLAGIARKWALAFVERLACFFCQQVLVVTENFDDGEWLFALEAASANGLLAMNSSGMTSPERLGAFRGQLFFSR